MRWPWRRSPPIRIVMYGKPGCHLCEDARALLLRAGHRYPLTVEEIDITGDPVLFRAYDIRIPVIVVGADELDAPIDEGKLRKLLAKAARKPAPVSRPSKSG